MNERPGASVRQRVADRAKGCCEYCRSQAGYAVQAFSVEHIVARSRSGSSTLGNLALACQACNNHKYNKQFALDPASGERVPLFHPRQQKWHQHFAWNNDYSLVIGVTPTGRATVKALQLNREGVVNLRRLLYAVHKHPPESS